MAFSSVTTVIGDSGSGKSTLIYTFILWVWRRYKVVTRLYSCDPGGWSEDIEGLRKLGICEVWKVYSRDPDGASKLATETLLRATQGFWPEQIDPESGLCPRGARLLPPPAGWTGAVAYDGLTSMCDWAMLEMGQRSADGSLGGEASAIKAMQSGEVTVGYGNRGSVGAVQTNARTWVLQTLSIKGLVAAPVFTALEAKGMDADTRLLMYGPQLIGKAKTAECPAWLGHMLNALGPVEVDGKPQWRLYLRDYKWPAGDSTPHKAKVRASARIVTTLPEYLADAPGASGKDALVKFNLGYFLELIEKAARETEEQARAEFADAPGMKASTYDKKPEGVSAAAAGPAGPKVVGPKPAGPGPAAGPKPGPAVSNTPKPPAPGPVQKVEGQPTAASPSSPVGTPAAAAVAAPASPTPTTKPASPPPPPGPRPAPAAPSAVRAPVGIPGAGPGPKKS